MCVYVPVYVNPGTQAVIVCCIYVTDLVNVRANYIVNEFALFFKDAFIVLLLMYEM